MWKSSLQLDKFQYARTSPYIVKGIGILGILTTLLMTYGLFRFLQLNAIYYIIFGPVIFIFVTNKLLRFALQLFYQKFDISKHRKKVKDFWTYHHEPFVDIFLPYAGEDLQIHEEVVKAVSELNYKNYTVYMLDDVGSIQHKALADKYGFRYLSRPNKGVYKKSGNLEYGYSQSTGEFIFVLDADFIPIKDALHDLIPYIASQEKIGILQTPQYFEQTNEVHSRSKIEFGGGNIVEDFYRIIMPCRDEFNAAMCVGTSAIYRRRAIQKLNGTPKVHASEDLATGLLITQHGYHVKYLPLIVSMGKSPETYQGYFKQHMRWCSGNLVFAKYWPIARLSVMARLIYIINPMYYLSEALTVIFSFQFLVLLYFHGDSLSWYHSLYFLPYVILSRAIIPLTRSNKTKVGTKLAAMNNSYTYFYTYIRMLTKGVPTWHPTGVKQSGLHDDFVSSFNIGTAISSSFIICFTFVLISKPSLLSNPSTYIVLGWSFYSAFWHVLYLTAVAEYVHPFRIKFARNAPDLAFAYVKKHMIFLLYCVLISSALFSFTLSRFFHMNTGNASATLALATPAGQRAQNLTAQHDISRSTTASAATPTPTFSYSVEPGDSLIQLAKKAINTYSEMDGITLTENQTNYASYYAAEHVTSNSRLRPGDEVSFSAELVIESVLLAKEKWNDTALVMD